MNVTRIVSIQFCQALDQSHEAFIPMPL